MFKLPSLCLSTPGRASNHYSTFFLLFFKWPFSVLFTICHPFLLPPLYIWYFYDLYSYLSVYTLPFTAQLLVYSHETFPAVLLWLCVRDVASFTLTMMVRLVYVWFLSGLQVVAKAWVKRPTKYEVVTRWTLFFFFYFPKFQTWRTLMTSDYSALRCGWLLI